MLSWREFWDTAHSIYVNDRHKDVHYRDVAGEVAAFVPRPDARVLDHGSGEAIHADLVAARAREVLLCDAAASVRAAIASRFAANPKIKAIAPEEVERLPAGSLDLIFANSLVQYLTESELDALLGVWRTLLAPEGILIVADVIPPDVGAASDAIALIRYAAANGFLGAALLGLTRTALSPYSRLRNRLGIARYDEATFLGKLQAAGFTAERLAHNVEHNPARMTFRARLARKT
ncbi:MAG: methyltransferase domain-containing protein [Alphaproteobacteria bacterium]|nr:methyltransferase domain-containing protein [Alphaproteobacteria bacterium]